MPERCLQWTCEGDTLVGILHEPDGEARAVGVLVIVGGPQYRVGSHRQFVLMARKLAAAGYPVLRFDYRGMGDSTGDIRTFEQVDADVRSAVDVLCAAGSRPSSVVVFGLCDAASAAMMYAASDRRIGGLMLANPWVRTEASAAQAIVRHYYGSRLLQKSFWAKVVSGEFEVLAALRSLFDNLARSRANQSHGAGSSEAPSFIPRMLSEFQQFAGPTLLLLSERDMTAKEFSDLCRENGRWRGAMTRDSVSEVLLPDTDHTFSNGAGLGQAVAELVAWLDTRIGDACRAGDQSSGLVGGKRNET